VAPSAPPEPPPSALEDEREPYDPSLDERRVSAAKNIFDAEEVTP
jgi:hypothetical protein